VEMDNGEISVREDALIGPFPNVVMIKKKTLLLKQINEAPEPLRSYIHDLTTATCSEFVEENYALSENLEGVRRMNAMLKDQVLDLDQVIKKLKVHIKELEAHPRRTCALASCNRKFYPKDRRQKYCSPECRLEGKKLQERKYRRRDSIEFQKGKKRYGKKPAKKPRRCSVCHYTMLRSTNHTGICGACDRSPGFVARDSEDVRAVV